MAFLNVLFINVIIENLQSKDDTRTSKTLSWILRHGALKEGLNITSDGFVKIEDILSRPKWKNQFTLDDIKRVTDNNSKKRFTIKSEHSVLYIKANQGHTIEVCIINID